MSETTVGGLVTRHAAERPEALALLDAADPRASCLTWSEYDSQADALAGRLVGIGLRRGERVGVLVPDGPEAHVAFVGCERAGVVAVGASTRAGERELAHLFGRAGAHNVIVTPPFVDRVAEPIVLNGGGSSPTSDRLDRARAFGPAEFSFLNSTSGTTGLPKLVMHNQARWFAFHDLAAEAADLTPDDVWMSVVPAPFGFGLWTSHFTPAILGNMCIVTSRFDPESTLAAIEQHRVTVLAAVTTQFVMLLESPSFAHRDLSSLRVLFTGGEAVPFARAAAFEDRTGARVLQFYGSNETGALSRTTLRDDREVRLRTAGRLIPSMHVRLEAGGVPSCKGPLLSLGYYEDPAANGQLYTPDGWMRMGDVVQIDADVLTVVGRTSDFIIRGGKNISAPQVEAEVGSHPAVAMAAAVAVPDPVFGERVCIFVVARDGADAPSLDDLRTYLAERGVGKELWPERLEVVDDLPRSSGGKIAKADLKAALLRPRDILD